jgi:hypothetical protein
VRAGDAGRYASFTSNREEKNMKSILGYFLFVILLLFLSSGMSASAQTSPPASDRIDLVLDEVKALRNEVKDIKSNRKSFTDPAILSALAIAIGGWVVTFTILWRTNKFQSKVKADSLIAALESFSGGTQKRSIGIGIIEGHWDDREELRKVWASILHNQAIYLLTQAENDKTHERQNLARIMHLLESARSNTNLLTSRQLNSLVEAIRNNRDSRATADEAALTAPGPVGITVSSEQLAAWERAFS